MIVRLVLSILFAGCLAGPAFAGCPAIPAATVSVTPVYDSVAFDYSRTTGELNALSGGEVTASATIVPSHTLGLATTNIATQIKLIASVTPMPDGTFCATPKDVALEFGFRDNTILVSRDLPRGTCIHDVIIEHERKHVAVDRELLRSYVPRIEAYFRQVAAGLRPVRLDDKDAATARLNEMLSTAMQTVLDDFAAERNRRQSQVDTPAEYARVARSCDGEVGKYLTSDGRRRF